ncbi:hypothetical protein PAECIP111890_00536 [Paenibacillus sp. JJ-223]|nr:hypothetical protein PAECIP111890_00536 [Paenibacillus sp. JJ-223]
MNKLPTGSLFGFYGIAEYSGLHDTICYSAHLSYIMLSNKTLIYIIFIDMMQVELKEGDDYNTIQSRIQQQTVHSDL